MWLKNKNSRPVDTVIVNEQQEIKINSFSFGKPATKIEEAKDYGMHIFKLGTPLLPGDSIKFTYNLSYFPKGFSDRAETEVIYNGTFFNSGVLPNFGYSDNNEISNNKTRKKFALKDKPRMNAITDTNAWKNTYIAKDADWIDFECVVSTSPDQTAIAPGYLQKTWEKDGRKFFHYKMDCKILNFYAFLSARYDVVKDVWVNPADKNNKVNIEIYYHKVHTYNLDRMIRGIKLSLDYYTKNFSPYQHKQVRILEFPRYATFAQSFPNTIPFSEAIGFVMKVDKDDPESIDMPLYVTAHEVAHQWWAHQVIGADVQGATLMSETMSQYSALMVMEKEYGKVQMKKFLRYELDRYLKARATESRKELPIMLAENQQYIHYNKGSLVMYALRDYIGEDSLNAVLRRYIKKVAYQEAPYTTSAEFVNYLKQATPDSLKYVIKDLFETITLYNNSVKDLSYTALPNGKYKVKITVNSIKYRADSLGKQKEIELNDWIDIGVFAEKTDARGNKTDKELYLKKMKVTKTNEVFEIVVDEKPAKVGIDPYNKLIDRTPKNNIRAFGAPYERDALSLDGLVIKVGGDDE
jgi:ABC-2 type transport system permease protein